MDNFVSQIKVCIWLRHFWCFLSWGFRGGKKMKKEMVASWGVLKKTYLIFGYCSGFLFYPICWLVQHEVC